MKIAKKREKEKLKLSIIIVNFNADQYLQKCLESIGQNKLWEIIVIDNEKINIGYGSGCNLGAKKAKGKYLFFLNPDTIVLSQALSKMIMFMEKTSEVGILGPRLYRNFKKEIQLSFCRFPSSLSSIFVYSPIKSLWPNNPFWNKHIYKKQLKTKKEIEVDAVAGAALMIRTDVFKRVGGFDKNFFLYFEENDLCRRVQNIGKKIVFFPKAEIIHFGGKSTFSQIEAFKEQQKSRFYFFKKYYGSLIAFPLEFFIRFLERLT